MIKLVKTKIIHLPNFKNGSKQQEQQDKVQTDQDHEANKIT